MDLTLNFRHSEHILKGVGSTDTIRDLCEGIHNNILILKEWNSDSSDSVATSLVEIKDKLSSPVSNKVGESVDKMSSQLIAMRTLLVDTLTVLL